MNSISYILKNPEKQQEFFSCKRTYAFSAALIGAVLFFLIYGIESLWPTNVSFLYNSTDADVFNHQLGFDFYRIAPWRNPIGLQSLYPYPYLGSVIYTDSIPILAFFFKLISPILPEYFQYFGLWIFICFMLQGVSASLIFKKLGISYTKTMLCVPFFILNVPFLFRCFHHSALAGQWLILFSFLLILCEKEMAYRKRAILWSLLCFGSILIQGYLFFCVGFLMSFSCFYQFIKYKKRGASVVVFFSCVVFSVFAYYIGGGMLTHQNIIMGGYPYYLFDPADLINPLIYSSFLPPIVYLCSLESSVYWGIAFMALLITAIVFLIIKRKKIAPFYKEHRFIVCLVLLASLFLFLVSEGIAPRIAGQTLFDLREVIRDYDTLAALSTMRSTARFILPVLYLLQLCVFYIICRGIHSRRIFLCVMIPCIVLQYAEIVPRTAKGRADSIVSGYPHPFNDSFDRVFNENAKHLSYITTGYEDIAFAGVFASHHHMSLNTSKACRGPKNSVQFDVNAWNTGRLSDDTVYLIPDDNVVYLSPQLLPENYLIYYCDEKLCIFNKELMQEAPPKSAVAMDRETLYSLLEYYYDPALAETPFDTFDSH
ncbi:MAG: DUF6311 domain-containing protein [Lachnospiraceae bacterium]|nr:DUF6311 domain-containing protein [Lachnospiraceae bacterium]